MAKRFAVIVGVSLVVVALLLSGCGGGGGTSTTTTTAVTTTTASTTTTTTTIGPTPPPTPPPPTPAPTPKYGPCDCTPELKRGHCTTCRSDPDVGVHCTACSDEYEVNDDTASVKANPDLNCVKKCGPKKKNPDKPANVQGNNGVEWTEFCEDTLSEAHFFGIGDWGGFCGYNGGDCAHWKPGQQTDCSYLYGTENVLPNQPCPMPNRHGATGPYIKNIEGHVQQKVADRMHERAKELKDAGTPVQFIVNVGDNFYPGGIDVHCGAGDVSATQHQFREVWKGVYGNLTDLEWWGVLGNHDYGGTCYIKGWDQQIWYTYNQDSWLMPGQYWKRSVQFQNFKMDFFFIDGNWYDTNNTGAGELPGHNLCPWDASKNDGVGAFCQKNVYPPKKDSLKNTCEGTGPMSGDDCPAWFNTLWKNQYKWLMKEVPASDADWQVLVTHYPGFYALGAADNHIDFTKWAPKMGIDLIISGHTHFQRILYGDMGGEGDWSHGTANVITGGGGGVSSEIIPTPDGHDESYGYMEFTASLHELNIKTYTHGGVQNAKILKNQTTIYPIPRKSDEEIIQAGLDPQNLLRRQQVDTYV